MHGVLHVSYRVRDPQRTAEIFADLLEGEIFPQPLNPLGVVTVALRRDRESWLIDMLEFWPATRHWDGGLVELDDRGPTWGHIALVSDKTYDDLEPIAAKHGLKLQLEPRGMPDLVPVVYDEDGNYFEFFPPTYAPYFPATWDASEGSPFSAAASDGG